MVRQGPAQARQADKMSKNREAMPPLLASDGWMTGQGTFGRPKSVFWTIPHWYQSNGLPSPTLIFLEDRSVGRVEPFAFPPLSHVFSRRHTHDTHAAGGRISQHKHHY